MWRGPHDRLLEVDRVVAERRLGLALRARERRLQLVLAVDEAHAAPAAARRRLQHHRVADARRRRLRRGRRGEPAAALAVVAGDDRHARGLHQRARRRLAAHRADRRGRRPDERRARGRARLGEVGVLGQEAVAGVDGVGAGLA